MLEVVTAQVVKSFFFFFRFALKLCNFPLPAPAVAFLLLQLDPSPLYTIPVQCRQVILRYDGLFRLIFAVASFFNSTAAAGADKWHSGRAAGGAKTSGQSGQYQTWPLLQSKS